jgi:hypothetical protein
VLALFVRPLWLPAVFVFLLVVAVTWRAVARYTGGLLLPLGSHLLADFCIAAVMALKL